MHIERIVAFRDLNPHAPTRFPVVPTTHVEHLSAFAQSAEAPVAARPLGAAAGLGTFGPGGFRVAIGAFSAWSSLKEPMPADRCATCICTCWPDGR